MSRPVDLLVEFLQSEQSRGNTHVHLDEEARDGLRALFEMSRPGRAKPEPAEEPPPAAAVAPVATVPTQAPPSSPEPLPSSRGASKHEQLSVLRNRASRWQPAAALGTLRSTLVFSEGSPDARIMLIGEAPSYHEEKEQVPFVGPAGEKMTEILKAMGLPRAEVYLTNLVKFRPAMPKQTTNNRRPAAEEMAACLPILLEEIQIVQPECIIALGATTAEGLLGHKSPISDLRTEWHQLGGVPVRVTYHPSYLLQTTSSDTVKRQLWEDMLTVMEKLDLPISEKQRSFFLKKN